MTREGRVVIGLAFFVGFAAINTGNNLLFLGWGLVLSSIVISGVLSEATLRPLELQVDAPAEARAASPTAFGLCVDNQARRSIFGVELTVLLEGPAGNETARAPHLLRLGPGATQRMLARFQPMHRGAYRVTQGSATTRFPFGFFVKTRPLRLLPSTFWVAPARVDVSGFERALRSRRGESSAQLAGLGEDYFDLRPYRPGDDLRRVRWRRAARSRRWVVVETEAMAGREITLELHLPPSGNDEACEFGIATTGSIAEFLLARGLRVGLRIPGLALAPRGGERQRLEILLALARLDIDARPALPSQTIAGARVAVLVAGAQEPAHADLVLYPEHLGSGKKAA
ncbi:MAG: DUF58 domain-containing protein [Myxococcota bacterium]